MGEASLRATMTGHKAAATWAKRLGLFLGGAVVLVAIAILFLRPYSRLERIAADALNRHAPRGTTVNGISVTFPLNIVLTNLIVPVQMQGRQQQIEVEELSGKISPLSLFFGELELGVNSDFFGGTLWLDVNAKGPSMSDSAMASRVAFDARARGMDISLLSDFLGGEGIVSGFCDADVEGELENDDLTKINGRALAIGHKLYISPVDVGGIVLPENTGVKFKTKLSAKRGIITVNSLRMKGSAYDLLGKGTVRLMNPPEQSRINCSFFMIFKEPPIISDQSLADAGAGYVLDALTESGAKVFFKLTGIAGKPQIKLDPSSSIGSLLQNGSR